MYFHQAFAERSPNHSGRFPRRWGPSVDPDRIRPNKKGHPLASPSHAQTKTSGFLPYDPTREARVPLSGRNSLFGPLAQCRPVNRIQLAGESLRSLAHLMWEPFLGDVLEQTMSDSAATGFLIAQDVPKGPGVPPWLLLPQAVKQVTF